MRSPSIVLGAWRLARWDLLRSALASMIKLGFGRHDQARLWFRQRQTPLVPAAADPFGSGSGRPLWFRQRQTPLVPAAADPFGSGSGRRLQSVQGRSNFTSTTIKLALIKPATVNLGEPASRDQARLELGSLPQVLGPPRLRSALPIASAVARLEVRRRQPLIFASHDQARLVSPPRLRCALHCTSALPAMIKLGLSWDLFRKFLAMLNRFKPLKDDHLVNRREALAAINLCGFRLRSGSPDAFTPTTPTASTSIAFGSLWAMLNRFGFASHVQAAASTFGHALNVNVARFKFAAVNAVRFAMLNPFNDHAGPAMRVLRSALATMIKLALSWDLIRKFLAMLNRFNEACRVYVALPLHVYVAHLRFVLVCHLVGFALRVYAGHALPSIVLGACELGSLRVEESRPPVVAVRRETVALGGHAC